MNSWVIEYTTCNYIQTCNNIRIKCNYSLTYTQHILKCNLCRRLSSSLIFLVIGFRQLYVACEHFIFVIPILFFIVFRFHASIYEYWIIKLLRLFSWCQNVFVCHFFRKNFNLHLKRYRGYFLFLIYFISLKKLLVL